MRRRSIVARIILEVVSRFLLGYLSGELKRRGGEF
jgi:hypothetical protein